MPQFTAHQSCPLQKKENEMHTFANRPTCHVVTHVHWDREWYRPFEAYRARLIELVTRVCRQLDSGALDSFHLDGQTITLADVLELAPELEAEITRHLQSGVLTVGPWHVLSDNQLVSGENLVRNLLTARRWGALFGALSTLGYSPDAFGHPADLPRVLAGFGIGTALVWRGAPPEHARFTWVAPDGSSVFAVNQAYHSAEVLWDEEGREDRLESFLSAEAARHPDGPWLLLNGGDHLAPLDTTAVLSQMSGACPAEKAVHVPFTTPKGAAVAVAEQSTLSNFFSAAMTAAATSDPLAQVKGELRYLGDRLTFLLPGTLSTRAYLKTANHSVETLLQRYAEPMAALAVVEQGRTTPPELKTSSPPSALSADPHRSLALVEHAWDLVLENAPHDSICGCSVDEVHRDNLVRAERATRAAQHVVERALKVQGVDVRLHGDRPTKAVSIVVLGHDADESSVTAGPVSIDILTAPSAYVTGLVDANGHSVPVEALDCGSEMAFAADIDLLPDSRESRRHRITFFAEDVPAFGWTTYTVLLGEHPKCAVATDTVPVGSTAVRNQDREIVVQADASLSVVDGSGRRWDGIAKLVDEGDRGDTYTIDPVGEGVRTPRVLSIERSASEVRTRLTVHAVLDLPVGIASDRATQSAAETTIPLTIDVDLWHDSRQIDWTLTGTNTARDHRLSFQAAVPGTPATWTAGQHFSAAVRPFAPEWGALPTGPGLEAETAHAPVHGYLAAGTDLAVALLPRGLYDGAGLTEVAGEPDSVLQLTLLRSVGWLSRFDLKTRTTGAGPMLATPEAQCLGPFTANIGILLGNDAIAPGDQADSSLALAAAAVRHGRPFLAYQVRHGTTVPTVRSQPMVEVSGVLVSALKAAEAPGEGVILRLSNPTSVPRTAQVSHPGYVMAEVRLDETDLGANVDTHSRIGAELSLLEFDPYGLRTFRLTTALGSINEEGEA